MEMGGFRNDLRRRTFKARREAGGMAHPGMPGANGEGEASKCGPRTATQGRQGEGSRHVSTSTRCYSRAIPPTAACAPPEPDGLASAEPLAVLLFFTWVLSTVAGLCRFFAVVLSSPKTKMLVLG